MPETDLIPTSELYLQDLSPALIAAHIMGDRHVRLLGDHEAGTGIPYVYNGAGQWVPALGDIRRAAAKVLDHRWRPQHDTALVRWVELTVPELQPANHTGHALNFRNGMLWLWTGEVVEHSYEPNPEWGDWTVQLPHYWIAAEDGDFEDKDDIPRAFDAFMEQTFPDPDMREFALEVMGYLLLIGNPFQQTFLFYGKGATGKSTLMHVIGKLLGQENIAAVSMSRLLSGRFNGAMLVDKLLNLAGETGAENIADPALLKALTGGDPISVERKGKDPFMYTPIAKHVFAANDFPKSEDATEAFFRRWVVLPFDHVVPPEDRLPEPVLHAQLTDPHELAGVLIRVVSALRRLIARGRFELPARAAEVRGEFTEGASDARGWLRERALLDPDATIRANDAWADYEQHYAARYGALGRNTFYAQLREIPGVAWTHDINTNQRLFTGLRLRNPRRP